MSAPALQMRDNLQGSGQTASTAAEPTINPAIVAPLLLPSDEASKYVEPRRTALILKLNALICMKIK